MKNTSLHILLLYVLEIPIKFDLKKQTKKKPSAALAILLAVANLEVSCCFRLHPLQMHLRTSYSSFILVSEKTQKFIRYVQRQLIRRRN